MTREQLVAKLLMSGFDHIQEWSDGDVDYDYIDKRGARITFVRIRSDGGVELPCFTGRSDRPIYIATHEQVLQRIEDTLLLVEEGELCLGNN